MARWSPCIEMNAGVLEVAITPDFHKGSGIPVGTTLFTRGFVLPQAIGNDINCGMRLYVTDLNEEQIRTHLDAIERNIRHVFFEGGRNIPMTRHMREKMFMEGLIGILDSHQEAGGEGIWHYYNEKQQEQDLNHVNRMRFRAATRLKWTTSDSASFLDNSE
ncbi:RtcB family protein [Paenibacillus thiaminolyticus]|uniref:RtcB family protein n=1 Tax=Paenibacillus TaxID=44249 RepID=UPI0030B8F27C